MHKFSEYDSPMQATTWPAAYAIHPRRFTSTIARLVPMDSSLLYHKVQSAIPFNILVSFLYVTGYLSSVLNRRTRFAGSHDDIVDRSATGGSLNNVADETL